MNVRTNLHQTYLVLCVASDDRSPVTEQSWLGRVLDHLQPLEIRLSAGRESDPRSEGQCRDLPVDQMTGRWLH